MEVLVNVRYGTDSIEITAIPHARLFGDAGLFFHVYQKGGFTRKEGIIQ